MKIINPMSKDRYMAKLFRIFVKAAAILMLSAAASQAQTAQKPIDSDSSDIKVLEERVKNMGEKMADNKAEIKDELDDKFQELNTRMYIYIGFVVAIIGFIGFSLNFFGKKTIRSWVDEKINEIAKEELDDRLEPIYIKYKDERTKELEERWESRLKGIEEMKKTLKKIEDRQTIPAEELEHAIKRLEEVKQEKEFSADDWLIKGYREHSKGNHEKATEYYSKAIGKNPKDPIAYNNRGFSYNILKEYKKAIDDFNMAIKLDPKLAIAYQSRGQAYISLKEYEKAGVDLNVAIELIPDGWYPLNALATVDIVTGNYEDALKIFEKALILDLDYEASAILYYKKCIITKLLGSDTTEIEKVFAEALEKEFDIIRFYFDDITTWLSEVDLPPDTRRFIEEKTEMMKKKRK